MAVPIDKLHTICKELGLMVDNGLTSQFGDKTSHLLIVFDIGPGNMAYHSGVDQDSMIKLLKEFLLKSQS